MRFPRFFGDLMMINPGLTARGSETPHDSPAKQEPLAQQVDAALDRAVEAMHKRRNFLLDRIRANRDEVLDLDKRLSRISPFIPDNELEQALEGAFNEPAISSDSTRAGRGDGGSNPISLRQPVSEVTCSPELGGVATSSENPSRTEESGRGGTPNDSWHPGFANTRASSRMAGGTSDHLKDRTGVPGESRRDT